MKEKKTEMFHQRKGERRKAEKKETTTSDGWSGIQSGEKSMKNETEKRN